MAALLTLLGFTGKAGEVPQECLLITPSLSSSIPKASLDSQAWIPHSTPNLEAWEDRRGESLKLLHLLSLELGLSQQEQAEIKN